LALSRSCTAFFSIDRLWNRSGVMFNQTPLTGIAFKN
jgi:hypothetical protein